MKNIRAILALGAAGILLAACSQANSGPPTLHTVNPGSSNYSKLQFAVGTANLDGTIAVNVVSTLRQPSGMSAVLVDSPSITLPFNLTGQTASQDSSGSPDGYSTAFSTGPSPSEIGGDALTSTPQTMHLGAPVCPTVGPGCTTANVSTFGLSGGVFGMGLQPANNTINSTAYQYTPYPQPIFAPASAEAFSPWGGPPAFDDSANGMGTRDGLHNLGAGLLGWNDGITIFQFTGIAQTGTGSMTGQYTMNVVIPTGGSSTATVSANANLNGATVLPAIAAPPALTEDGNGGGSFSVSLPAGATEGYVTVVDLGPCPAGTTNAVCQTSDTNNQNCQGALGTKVAPVYYTIEVVPGTASYNLADTIGPNTTQNGPSSLTPSMTLCTAAANSAIAAGLPSDQYQVQFFAMDYPLYEASYPKNTQQTPAIVGAAGQDDITVSPPSAPVAY